jgi:hypothetical protein
VPRFYFHFSDGSRQFSDDSGLELSGLRDARAHATQQVRELKAAMCDPHIQDLSGWSMNVTDGRGRTVFVLGFDLKPRPIGPATPRPGAPLTPAASPGTSPAPPLVPRSAPARAGGAKPPSGRAGAATKN